MRVWSGWNCEGVVRVDPICESLFAKSLKSTHKCELRINTQITKLIPRSV